MQIFIPTLGRKTQTTYESLPPSIQRRVEFVLNHSTDQINVPIGAVFRFVRGDGIAAVRQRILEIAEGPFIMLDDDLVFATRRTDEPSKFHPATPGDIEQMFTALEALLEDYAHVGVASREGGNRNIEPLILNTRNLRILGYVPARLHQRSIRFDRLPVMEDFDVALQLLRCGYPSAQLNWIVHDQKSSNAPGGCSTYRTPAIQRQAAEGLERLHPNFVNVVQKTTKTAWGGGTRYDVRIAWKRAYSAGRATDAVDGGKGTGTRT